MNTVEENFDRKEWYENNKKKCKYCGKYIPLNNLKPSTYIKRKFCDQTCFKAQKKNNIVINHCKNCGKEIGSNRIYCSQKCQLVFMQKEWESQWLSGNINGNTGIIWKNISNRVKTYLLNKYNYKCAKCGWSERNQYTGKIPLEVEHIDGDPYNTTPDNVTLLCPNCHSLTSTYKGANKGNGRNRTWYPDVRD